jgi:hypothetical protein
MRLLLTTVLAVHWMAVFAMLAIVMTIEPGRGSLAALELLGVGLNDPFAAGSTSFAAFLSLGFFLVAALFLWALITALFGSASADAEEVSRLAYAGGAIALTSLLLAGAVQPVSGLFIAIGTLLGALTVSYLAVVGERLAIAAAPPAEAPVPEFRSLASEAAHNAMLSALSGRARPNTDEVHA